MAKGNNNKPNTNKSKKDDKNVDGEKAAPVKGAQKIKVRHILCSKFSKKEEALALLLKKGDEGKRFSEVATMYSEDKANKGGSLGEITKVGFEPEFVKVAFSLPECDDASRDKYAASLGQAKTSHGYHIILREPLKK